MARCRWRARRTINKKSASHNGSCQAASSEWLAPCNCWRAEHLAGSGTCGPSEEPPATMLAYLKARKEMCGPYPTRSPPFPHGSLPRKTGALQEPGGETETVCLVSHLRRLAH